MDGLNRQLFLPFIVTREERNSVKAHKMQNVKAKVEHAEIYSTEYEMGPNWDRVNELDCEYRGVSVMISHLSMYTGKNNLVVPFAIRVPSAGRFNVRTE